MTAPLELWTLGNSSPRSAARRAAKAESVGWDGIAVVDSQNLSGDSWVALTAMAAATKEIGLGTAVTNPVTRHPAVTASAAASLAVMAGDRVTVGIGRGDSALAHLGRAPASVALLESYMTALRAYLHREPLNFDDLGFHEIVAPDVATLGLADSPEHSRLRWLQDSDPIVEVEVAATGPRVIAAAARSADRILFALGADPERIRWGIEVAKSARISAGLDVDGLQFGAYLNVVVHPDVAIARSLVAGSLSTFARFSVMHGTVSGPTTDTQREVLHGLNEQYDMKSHTRTDSAQANALTDDFIEQYAIVGPAGHCIERLDELAALGLTKAMVIGPSAGSDRTEARAAEANIASSVLAEFS